MPQPKKYASTADRQKAYRQRQAEARAAERAAKGLPPAPAISTMPSTQRWQAMIANARTILAALEEEISTYSQERSESWQETDRASNLRAAQEQLSDILDCLDSLSEDVK